MLPKRDRLKNPGQNDYSFLIRSERGTQDVDCCSRERDRKYPAVKRMLWRPLSDVVSGINHQSA